MRIQNVRNRCRAAIMHCNEGFEEIAVEGLRTSLSHACLLIMFYDLAPRSFARERKHRKKFLGGGVVEAGLNEDMSSEHSLGQPSSVASISSVSSISSNSGQSSSVSGQSSSVSEHSSEHSLSDQSAPISSHSSSSEHSYSSGRPLGPPSSISGPRPSSIPGPRSSEHSLEDNSSEHNSSEHSSSEHSLELAGSPSSMDTSFATATIVALQKAMPSPTPTSSLDTDEGIAFVTRPASPVRRRLRSKRKFQ